MCKNTHLKTGEKLSVTIEKMFGATITGRGLEAISLTEIYPITFDSSDTSTWQTYRNEEFGFEFQYPNDWQVDEERREPSFTSLIVRPKAEEGERNDLAIIIREYDDESQTMSKEAIEELFGIYRSLEAGEVYAPPGARFAGSKIKNIIIDNYIAPRLGSGQETSISTYVAARDHHFEFILRLESYATLEKFEGLTDQILSTFRFIKLTDTLGWQTYRNEEFGFEVKYPKDWAERSWNGPLFSTLSIFHPDVEQALDKISRGEFDLSDGIYIRMLETEEDIEQFIQSEYGNHPFELDKEGILE
ncbi:hypothetical protein IID24_05145, partial [Patescibacteria group bacterium]|nr:hypothetical protein [Patescibacteria group bacterium]